MHRPDINKVNPVWPRGFGWLLTGVATLLIYWLYAVDQLLGLKILAGLLFAVCSVFLFDWLVFQFSLPRLRTFGYAASIQRLIFSLACLAGWFLVFAIPLPWPDAFAQDPQASWLGYLFSLLLGSLLGILLFGVISFLATILPEGGKRSPSRWKWLLFALPMLISYAIGLLAFYPGMMSGDSVAIWGQVQQGVYENAHPVLYSWTIWALTRLWNGPAIVPLFQAGLLALLVAWELGFLTKHGLPVWAAWVVAGLFALSPANVATVLTIWKDIPYSIAILALSFLMLNGVIAPQTFKSKYAWLVLALVCLAVGLLRFNGFPVAPVTLLALALAYRFAWKTAAKAFVLFMVIWLAFQGPLLDLFQVKRAPQMSSAVGIFHVGAHIKTGTPLEPAERELVDAIAPSKVWNQYHCNVINTLTFDPDFSNSAAAARGSEINALALRLMMRNPLVDVNHILCSGALVYRFTIDRASYLYTTPLVIKSGIPLYVPENTYRLGSSPRIPALAPVLANIVLRSTEQDVIWLFWGGGLSLFVFIISGLVFCLRMKTWRAALYLVPGITQSGVLLLVNIAQDFRYVYSMHLLALFAACLVFLPVACWKNQQSPD